MFNARESTATQQGDGNKKSKRKPPFEYFKTHLPL